MKKKKKKAKKRRRYKVKEITISRGGVIPTGAFENDRRSYSYTFQPFARADSEQIEKIADEIEDKLERRFVQAENQAKVDAIERQYPHIRSREKGGKKYPSVTSILYFDVLWRVSQDELNQYAARGNIIHRVLEIYFETHKWVEPEKIPELKDEIATVLGGSLGFHWNDCSYKKFIDHYKKKINITKTKTVIYNDEHVYSGEEDAVGTFDGKRAIMDCKTGSYNMAQLAAYAVCEDRIESLVVFPIGPTDNVSGYMRPVICEDIEGKFKVFLKARKKFRERFGI